MSQAKQLELIIGVVGIVVGLGGIYTTVLTFPAALDAVGSALMGAGLPASFKSVVGVLTLFLVVVVGLVALVALAVGLICLSELVFSFFGVPRARLVAISFTVWLLWVAIIITIALYDVESGFAFLIWFGGIPLLVTLGLFRHSEKGKEAAKEKEKRKGKNRL